MISVSSTRFPVDLTCNISLRNLLNSEDHCSTFSSAYCI